MTDLTLSDLRRIRRKIEAGIALKVGEGMKPEELAMLHGCTAANIKKIAEKVAREEPNAS